jgi:hypothetical protein
LELDNLITGNGYQQKKLIVNLKADVLRDKTVSKKDTKILQIPDDGRSGLGLCPDTVVDWIRQILTGI